MTFSLGKAIDRYYPMLKKTTSAFYGRSGFGHIHIVALLC